MKFHNQMYVISFGDGVHYFVRGDQKLVFDLPHDGLYQHGSDAVKCMVEFLNFINQQGSIQIVEKDGTDRMVNKEDDPDYFNRRYYRIGTVELYCNL